MTALCLTAATLLAAWALWPELTCRGSFHSDLTLHLGVMHQLDAAVTRGGSPFDFYYDGSPFGHAFFRTYQHLPHLVVWGIWRLLGRAVELATVLRTAVWLLGVCLPLSVFSGGRMLGLSYRAAGCASLCVVALHQAGGYGLALHNAGWAVGGLFTQQAAGVCLGPALGSMVCLAQTGRGWARAVAWCGLALACHPVAGVLLVLAAGVVLVAGSGSAVARLGRLTGWGLAAMLVDSYQLVPLWQDRAWVHMSRWEPAFKHQGNGAAWIWAHLWDGSLLDQGRLPVLTALAMVGAFCALLPRGVPRVLPLWTVLWLVVWCGPATFGSAIEKLPLLGAFHFHRLVLGVGLAGTWLAGAGADQLTRAGRQHLGNGIWLLAALWGTATMVPMVQMWRQQAVWQRESVTDEAADADLARVLVALDALPRGRVFTGTAATWADSLKVGRHVKLHAVLTGRGMPAMGMLYHSMHRAGDLMFDFQPGVAPSHRRFGVAYVLAPSSWWAPAPLVRLMTAGRYALWQDPEATSIDGAQTVTITSEHADELAAQVGLQQNGYLRLIRGWHPRWQAWVDQKEQTPRPSTDGFVEIAVPAGNHAVKIRYSGSWLPAPLALLGVLTVAALWLVERRQRRPA